MSDNPYVDERTGTFRNKLGITDPQQMADTEYRVTAERIAEIEQNPIPGDYGLEHMCRVHEKIFGDLYEWAGKPRTLNISKREPYQSWISRFADKDRLEEAGALIAGDVKAMKGLQVGLDKAEVITALTWVFTKMNFMHPMPEGNGRTTQTMLKQLARDAGYELDYSKVTKQEWNSAAARTMPQHHAKEPGYSRKPDFQPMLAVFDKIATPARTRDKAPSKGVEPSGKNPDRDR